MPFSVSWYTLLDHAEDLPPGATLVTPLSRKRFRLTDTQEHRLIVEFDDTDDARPLQREQFETLHQHIQEDDGRFELDRIPPDAEPYAAVLTLHPRFEIDANAGIIRETDDPTGTQVLAAGDPDDQTALDASERAEPDLDVYADAIRIGQLCPLVEERKPVLGFAERDVLVGLEERAFQNVVETVLETTS